MFTHSQLRNPGAQCQISYSGCPGSAAHPHYRPPFCRLLQQLFRWMIKVKAQPARVSPFLFEEEWASCHLLMHCLPLCMQTRQASSTVPPFISYVSQKTLLSDWSGASMASLETCGKSAHPAKQTKTHPHAELMWSEQGWKEDYSEQLIHGLQSLAPRRKTL